MKQVHLTITVSDSKYEQLLEFLAAHFGKMEVVEGDDRVSSEEQKAIVRERIKNTKPGDYISLEDFGIPTWHLNELDKRLTDYTTNPDQALDFDQAMDDIEKDL
jgi:hypothetical protein